MPITKEEARSIYRAAWMEYCLTSDEERKLELEGIMDGVQGACVGQEGMPKGRKEAMEYIREFNAFGATLPGFMEFWNGFRSEMEKEIDDKKASQAN